MPMGLNDYAALVFDVLVAKRGWDLELESRREQEEEIERRMREARLR